MKKCELDKSHFNLKLYYLNLMPREHGLSPAELLLHRKPRSHFPQLVEEVNWEKVRMVLVLKTRKACNANVYGCPS